ncbi:glycosyltransferase family 1 protein [Roseomonas sp. AR75]|uniref:glycosyltransferase family 4 protein n=1 Tax=Roseomonas sp. AR75 TaxID=2562311 RepID=UPI0010C14F8D|nr:glycosyltransferase family 1 protein [Roseomonas sp. AR75]
MTIWFDVEDLFEYAGAVARPSGIQRLSYEIYAAIQASDASRVGFLRHDPVGGTMRVVDWADVQAIYRSMTHGVPARAPAAAPQAVAPLLQSRAARLPLIGSGMRLAASRLPPEMRRPLGEAARAQVAAIRGLARFAAALPGALAARRRQNAAVAAPPPGEVAALPATPGAAPSYGRDIRDVAQPGDVLAALGSPWSSQGYPALVARLKSQTNLRFALLVYDLIPVMRPEFCDRGLVMLFSSFILGCLPLADELMTISRASAADLERWSARIGVRLATTPRPIPIGTGFSTSAETVPLPQGLVAGEYALFVSTVEARKNHLLAFRAWRRLLEELPPERVPQLVFAGRVGWMVADLMQQIRNSENLAGKLTVVENPDDTTLAQLYRGARFTLFPSLYEGWGLPVSESLAFGKVCLASGTTSVPEAGGRFCLYHDPDSVTEAVALYRRAIEEPGLIARLEAEIADGYRPTPWSSTAAAILDQLGHG